MHYLDGDTEGLVGGPAGLSWPVQTLDQARAWFAAKFGCEARDCEVC
jgi:hypothetical protein